MAALVATASLLLFVGVAGMAHADAQCRDVVETWTSGEVAVVGSTCDEPSEPPTGGDTEPSEPEAPHPDAIVT